MKQLVGDVCAHIPSEVGGKPQYVKIGNFFSDDAGPGEFNLSVKIDSLPLPNSNWGGWINLFERKPREHSS